MAKPCRKLLPNNEHIHCSIVLRCWHSRGGGTTWTGLCVYHTCKLHQQRPLSCRYYNAIPVCFVFCGGVTRGLTALFSNHMLHRDSVDSAELYWVDLHWMAFLIVARCPYALSTWQIASSSADSIYLNLTILNKSTLAESLLPCGDRNVSIYIHYLILA